jgi:hypothetical protein
MTSNLATSSKLELFPIRRTLLYIEWTVLASTAVIVILNGWNGWSFGPGTVTYLCLSVLALLSLFFPADRPLWQRRAYIALGIIVLLTTRALTDWDFALLLYLVLAKSCFLLNRREVVMTVIAAGIAWQLFSSSWNSSLHRTFTGACRSI